MRGIAKGRWQKEKGIRDKKGFINKAGYVYYATCSANTWVLLSSVLNQK
jgi:hypothetical protein